MRVTYQGSTHAPPKTCALAWRIANKARDLRLHENVPNREGKLSAKAVPDLRASGREKFASSSLATFNKKIREMIAGKLTITEEDEVPPVDLDVNDNDDEDYGDDGQYID